MGLTSHVKKPLAEVPVDKVFIGSCTNGRIEDIRAVASVAKGRKVHPNIKEALVVPGSGLVKEQAEEEVSDVLRSAADCLRLREGATNVHTDCSARILASTLTAVCAQGLDTILIEAGFKWREPGCSMCLAMNADKLGEYERCASTSNRNFEGRQGANGRTHLCSPVMAAAAAVTGMLTDVRKMALSHIPTPVREWPVNGL